MAETRFKSIDIHEGAKRLQRCHICDNEFNKYELELHFLTFHTDIENDDCDDQTTVDGPGFESDLITNNESDDKKEFQNVRYFKSENNLNEQNIIDKEIFMDRFQVIFWSVDMMIEAIFKISYVLKQRKIQISKIILMIQFL